jgi:WD40 repeat protein
MLADLDRWLRRSDSPALSDLESAFADASRRDAQRVRRLRRALGMIAFGFVIAFAVFTYSEIKIRDAQRLAETRLTQGDVEQGRQALRDNRYSAALIHLWHAARHGDESPGGVFMRARASEPLLAEVARLPTPSGRMWSASFSPDGKRVLTSDDTSARIWDAQSHRLLFVLDHADIVYAAMFSADGRTVFTAGGAGVKIWNAGDGTFVRDLTRPLTAGHMSYYGLAKSPGGDLLAAIDTTGGYAHVWDLQHGSLLQALATGSSAYQPVLAFSPDGQWLAVSGGGDVQVFATSSWDHTVTLPGPSVRSLSFDPTGPRIAVSTSTGDASIWSIPDGTRVHRMQEVGPTISTIAYSPNGELVVTAGNDGSARIWNAKTGGLQRDLDSRRNALLAAEFDPTSKLVVTAGADGVVAVSEVENGLPVSTFDGSQAPVIAAHFAADSRRVVSASWDGTARVWNALSPYRQWRSSPIDRDCTSDANLDEERRFVAVSCKNHGTYIWDTAHDAPLAQLPSVTRSGELEPAFPAVSAAGDLAALAINNTVALYALPGGLLVRTIQHPAAVTALAFATRGHDVVSGSVDGTVLVTHDDGSTVALPAFSGLIDVVAFSPEGDVVAAGPLDLLRVYNPDRGEVRGELTLPIHSRSFRMSPDGLRLIALPTDTKPTPPVLIDLSLAQPRIAARFDGHKGQVFSARFVRAGREILTAGSDGTVRQWDARTGRYLKAYLGSAQYLLDAALDPDGSILVTAGGDGWLRFWDVSSAKMIWTLRAHDAGITGLHFEGGDIVTRSSTGQLARWTLPKSPPAAELGELVRCLPDRFDEDTRALVPQPPCDTAP